jgi:hypothetical protein
MLGFTGNEPEMLFSAHGFLVVGWAELRLEGWYHRDRFPQFTEQDLS